MQSFTVPTKEQVSKKNQDIFDKLTGKLGFVPNLYAYYAKNENALGDYLTFQGRVSTLKAKEKEVINLIVSQTNNCTYCLSAHTAIAKMNGFSDEQIMELRAGSASFDSKLDALARFTRSAMEEKGRVSQDAKDSLLAMGYTEANIIDIAITIGEKTISNYIHNIAKFEIDFPVAPELEAVNVYRS